MKYKIGNGEFFVTDAGSEIGIYDPLDGTFVFCRGEIGEADYREYICALVNEGYKISEEYELGKNQYILLKNSDITAYVSFLGEAMELRAYAEPDGFSVAPPKQTGKAGEGDVTLIQLEVDSNGTRQNGGMTYIVKLSDGRFLLIDGGYYTDAEADRIYGVLKANTPDGERPRIAAWFLTHLHGDHYGGMIRFAEKYATECDLEGYYFSGFRTSESLGWIGMVDKFCVLRDMWNTPPAIYGKVHSGMSLDFSGTAVRILCTQEDVYPKSFIDANDASTVFRIDAGGQRILILGDCRDHECDAMLKGFRESGELKCDMVQYSHHGYEGATKEFYEAVDADVVLFPMNIVGWQENYKTVPQNVFAFWFVRTDRPAKDYLAEYMANSHIKKVIVAGAGQAELTLPYTPTGEVILDYEAFFEEHMHDVPNGYELKGYRYTDETRTRIEKII